MIAAKVVTVKDCNWVTIDGTTGAEGFVPKREELMLKLAKLPTADRVATEAAAFLLSATATHVILKQLS